MSPPACSSHRSTRLLGWRVALLWLMLALPWTQAWLVGHELSHRVAGPTAGTVQATVSIPTGAGGETQDTLHAHGACILCLAASALAHAAAPAVLPHGNLRSELTFALPAGQLEAWHPAAPRYYASRAPPLKA